MSRVMEPSLESSLADGAGAMGHPLPGSSVQLALPMLFSLRQMWPVFLGFWLLVLGGAWASPGWGAWQPAKTEGLAFFAFGVVPVLLVGGLLLGDGPRSPGAFWRTRPVSRSAAWDAKLAAIVGWVGLPMVVGHALVLWRMGLPADLFLPAVARAISGLALFAAWVALVAIPARRWSELLVVMLFSYIALGRAIFFALSAPWGTLIAQALVAVGLLAWLVLCRAHRSALRWVLFVVLAAAVGIGSYPLLHGNEVPANDLSSSAAGAAVSGPETSSAFSAERMNVTLEPVVGRSETMETTDDEPFLCAQLDLSRLVAGFAYELEPKEIRLADLYVSEAHQTPVYPSVWWIPTEEQLAETSDPPLPTEARLRLSRRLSVEQLEMLRDQWRPGMHLEIRGTLHRLEVTPATTVPLNPGAGALGPEGRTSWVELETFNRRLEGLLAEPVSWRHGPLMRQRDSRSRVRTTYGPPKDYLWVGEDRAWALRLPEVQHIRHVPDSYLAPFSGFEIRLSMLTALSPVGAARLDLPGSSLMTYERRDLAQAPVTLRLIPAAFDDLLCRRLPAVSESL